MTATITPQQQQTIDGILERMRADGWDNPTVAIRALADEADEFGNFTADEIEAAGEGAIVVFRDFAADATRVEWEIADRGTVIAADGRIVA